MLWNPFKEFSKENEEDERVLQEQFVIFNMNKWKYSMTETQIDGLIMEEIKRFSLFVIVVQNNTNMYIYSLRIYM